MSHIKKNNFEKISYCLAYLDLMAYSLMLSLPNLGFPGGSAGKESACKAEDLGSIPELGRFPGEGNGYPFQYSCLENSMDKEAWQATVHVVAKSWT